MLHRLAWAALISLIVLVCMGAIVRVTGSGLGCPDWPTCWGCVIPPTSIEQIDVDKLDIEKFKRHAVRHGIDPDTITRDTILDSFDPVHTWIEFSNRLTSLPLGLFTLSLALGSLLARQNRFWVAALSWAALLDVMGNAVMGAVVVRSGLKPGIITAHMALAFLLILVLVTIIWLTRRQPPTNQDFKPRVLSRRVWVVTLMFFVCLFGEGIMGSQVREQTDTLTKASAGQDRDQWASHLEATWVYKVHRSFSWTLLISSILLFRWSGGKFGQHAEPKWILGFVVAMMVMGVIMAHVSVYQIIQVVHVASTSVMLAITWHWILRLWSHKDSKLALDPQV